MTRWLHDCKSHNSQQISQVKYIFGEINLCLCKQHYILLQFSFFFPQFEKVIRYKNGNKQVLSICCCRVILKFNVTFLTFGDGGRFSSSENEGERGFRCRRVGLGVAGGEGEGVAGWDFPNDCSESSWRSSCSSEPESSLKESSSSRSSSSPLPCEPYATTEQLYKIPIFTFCLKINWSGKCCQVNFFFMYLAPVETQQVCCPLRLRSASSCAQRAVSSSSSFSLSSSLPPQDWCGPLVDGQHACSSFFHSNTLVTR